MPVELIALESRPLEQTGEFVGMLRSRRSTTVQSQAEGFLTRIVTTAGARVVPGTPLFEIDAGAQQAVVSTLEAQRASRQADVALARQQSERTERLVTAGAASQQELDQYAAAVKTADAQLQAVEQQIRQQQVELAYFRVVSQTAGLVGDIPVRVGDRITRAMVLTTVEDNAGLEVYVNVPVQQGARVRMGLPIRIVDDAGAVLVETKVSFISPSVDTATQSLLVKAPVGAPGALRADQLVRVHAVWSTQPGLLVPVVATQRINNRHFVFVAEGADGGLVARQRPVSVGPIIGSGYVVLDGLSAGDRVVLGGTQKIGDGAPVQVLPPGAAPAAPGGL